MNKESLAKRLGKKVLFCFLLGFLMFVVFSNYGCVDESFKPNSEEPEETEEPERPVAIFAVDLTEGDAPLLVAFDASLSYVRTSGCYLVEYHWDFDGDGNTDIISVQNWINYTYEEAGTYQASLIVVDSQGQVSDRVSETIVVNEEITDQIAFWGYPTIEGSGAYEDIFAMNEDGTDIRRLTTNPCQDFNPTWSPDGNKIAYVSNRPWDEGGNAIWVVDLDGNESRLFGGIEMGLVDLETFESNGILMFPSYSPDGSRIAFTYLSIKENSAEDRNGIAIWNEDNSFDFLTSDPCPRCFSAGYANWSPDGSKIVFDRFFSQGASEIWMMNSDGSGQEKIYDKGGYPDWSPDGSKIVFISGENGIYEPGSDIYIMDLENRIVTNITNDQEREGYPDWSPDGNRIAYSRMSADIHEGWIRLYIIDINTGEKIEPIPPGPDQYMVRQHAAGQPTWKPKKEE